MKCTAVGAWRRGIIAFAGHGESAERANPAAGVSMLPDLQLNDVLRLRKPHPCGSFEWNVVRLGADIGLECRSCGRRVMLTRRELMKRLKVNLTRRDEPAHS